jgi:hypothetical protein
MAEGVKVDSGTTKYALRLPTGLYEKLQVLAEREKRSVNAQIVYELARAVEAASTESRASDRRQTA